MMENRQRRFSWSSVGQNKKRRNYVTYKIYILQKILSRKHRKRTSGKENCISELSSIKPHMESDEWEGQKACDEHCLIDKCAATQVCVENSQKEVNFTLWCAAFTLRPCSPWFSRVSGGSVLRPSKMDFGMSRGAVKRRGTEWKGEANRRRPPC